MFDMDSFVQDDYPIEREHDFDNGYTGDLDEVNVDDQEYEPSDDVDETNYNPYVGGEDSYLDGSWEERCEVGYDGDY